MSSDIGEPAILKLHQLRATTRLLLWVTVAYALGLLLGWPKSRPLIADSVDYRALAMGETNQVLGSIAGRILHPLTVRAVSLAAGVNIDRAFFIVDLTALAVLLLTVGWIMKRTLGSAVYLLPLLLTPVLVKDMFWLYYCQDLFYAALLACFFVLLISDHLWLAVLLMFPLYLTRESTLLLAASVAGVAWLRSKRLLAGACGLVTVAGMAVARSFAARSLPNIHHMNEFAFLALKVPLDSMRNLMGIMLVPNELAGNAGFTCRPLAIIHLPTWLHVGILTQFGVCSPDLLMPLRTLTYWLTFFGIAPAVLGVILVRVGKSALTKDVWLAIAVIYGISCYAIAPFVSLWLERDMAYAWPAFWLAAPVLFKTFCRARSGVVWVLLAANAVICWLPYMLECFDTADMWRLVMVCFVSLVTDSVAVGMIWRAISATGETVNQTKAVSRAV